MPLDVAAKRAAFRALHREGCFVLPNPWDLGGVRRLEALGFKALASTSSGAALSLGKQDYELTRQEVLDHLRTLAAATDLPLNADFEGGFADAPEGVAQSVALAVDTGVAGLSIEDRATGGLYDPTLAAERIAAAREAIDRSGHDVMLVARCEGFLVGVRDLDAVIARLVAFSAAGADCLYAPGVRDLDAVRAVVVAVAPKPVNVLMAWPDMRVADLAEAGVRRVSVGGALARAAWAGFDRAAQALATEGTLPG
ncbi:MAG TPA: isocitrate lyase/phosphoenolpyruvate mutase family protein [Caulobacteraceae bacterium]|jgi:2-methylisocitrate lyase-like PEP mutase family enzyme|nr:isocitrate lyase/phosphoenolpyruvate mutase family protein [Caulobacteraceae bacterium]